MLPEEKKDFMRYFMANNTSHHSKDSDLQVLMYSEIVPSLGNYSVADICFLCDVTGSMDIYIETIKDILKNFGHDVSRIIGTSPRLAFIGFRDINDKSSLFIKGFTSNPEELIEAMNKVKCTGGHDVCEDIIEPLKAALKLEWKSDLMYIYILLDAPTHGKRYYEEKYHGNSDFDKYPNEDKKKLLEKLMCHYRRSKINLVLLQTNPITDKMIEIMKRNYNSYENKLTVIQIEEKKTMKEELKKGFEKNFIESMSNFSESRWNHFRKIKCKAEAINIAPDLRDNSEFVNKFQGEVYSAFIEGINFERRDFRYKLDIRKIHTDKCTVSKIDIGVGQFSKCRSLVIGNDPTYVIKIPKIPITNIDKLTNDIELSAFVELFVQKFNSLLNEKKNLIEKLDVVIIKNIDKVTQNIKGSTVYLAQKFIEGEYMKYNNNYGWVNYNMTKASMIAQAFSHFTYEYSLGTMLVVDVQGVFNGYNLVITDPAIHSVLFKDKFGYTNHGKVGILRFFRTHRCNEYCKRSKLLNLESIRGLSPSKLEAIRKKYEEEKELEHLYEGLGKKIKGGQTQIEQFDPTVEIELRPVDEKDKSDDNMTIESEHEDPEDYEDYEDHEDHEKYKDPPRKL